MANFDYKKAQKTALNLIKKFGREVTLARVTSTNDPVTGVVTVTDTQTTLATVVSLPASGNTVQAFDNKFKELLKQGKIRFFYAAAKGLAFEPDAGDYFEFDGKVWELAGSTPLNPAGLPVLYTLGVGGSNLTAIPTP